MKLEFDNDSYNDYIDENVYYNGCFTEFSLGIANDVCSYITVTFENDSPFAYVEENTKQLQSTSTTTYSSLNIVSSDVFTKSYISPIIEITPTATGTVKIKNKTDNNNEFSINVYRNGKVTINCSTRVISDENGLYEFYKCFDEDEIEDNTIYWLRLFYGKNELEILGNATIKIKYTERRMVGGY